MRNVSITTGQSGSMTELLSDSEIIEMDFSLNYILERYAMERRFGCVVELQLYGRHFAFSCVVIYVFRLLELLRLGRALLIGRAGDAGNN